MICPPVIGGADVVLETPEGGVNLLIIAAPVRTADVYDRLSQLAHSLSLRKPDVHADAHHGDLDGDAGSAPLPRAKASVSAAEGGARLVLQAYDPREAAPLRARVIAMIDRMRSGGCPPLPLPLERAGAPKQSAPAPAGGGHHH